MDVKHHVYLLSLVLIRFGSPFSSKVVVCDCHSQLMKQQSALKLTLEKKTLPPFLPCAGLCLLPPYLPPPPLPWPSRPRLGSGLSARNLRTKPQIIITGSGIGTPLRLITAPPRKHKILHNCSKIIKIVIVADSNRRNITVADSNGRKITPALTW